MIRAARRRHVVTWALGAVVVGVGFAAALAVRRPGLVGGTLPSGTAGDVIQGASAIESAVFGLEASGRAYRVGIGRDDDRAALVVEQVQGPIPPDQLVYWSDVPHARGDAEVAGVLLGGLSRGGSRFLLPPGTDALDGTVVVYSLAHQEVTFSTTFEGDDR